MCHLQLQSPPRLFLPMSSASEKYNTLAVLWRCLRDPMFSRFSRTPTGDRQTVRLTHGTEYTALACHWAAKITTAWPIAALFSSSQQVSLKSQFVFFVSGFRSDNFIVGLTDVSPATTAPTLWNYDVCAQYPGVVGEGATVHLPCTSCMPPRRYLIVQVELLNDALNFCEIEVLVRRHRKSIWKLYPKVKVVRSYRILTKYEVGPSYADLYFAFTLFNDV